MNLIELSKEEFIEFSKNYPYSLFFQSPYWIEIKKFNNWNGTMIGMKKENIRLYDNIVPYVGVENENNITHEEEKIELELEKILNGVEITTMCARVPVKHGHSAYVHLTFKDMIDFNRIKAFIENIECVKTPNVVTSSMVKDSKDVFVGRIKKDKNCPYALMFFITSDNLTIGSALNSYELFMTYKERWQK